MNIGSAVLALLFFSLSLLGGCASTAQVAVEECKQGKEPGTSAVPLDPAFDTRGPVDVGVAALQRDVEGVVADLQSNRDGEMYSAAVKGADPDDLAIAVALVDGRVFSAGKTAARFPLMSVSKPFTYALAVEQRSAEFMLERIGVSATGLPYNAVAAGAVRRTTEQNPMVNAGAIATHSYIEGANADDKIRAVVDLYSRMANQPLAIEDAWRATPRALTYTLAYQMQAAERLVGDVEDAANRYLESNIVAVRVDELAQMGATLASGGIQPVTGQRILKPETVRTVLSAMVIAGMYEDSGSWWTRVGVPAKSGVSGAIVAVAPGWGAIVAYSPRLDAAGNSVRGAIAIEQLVDRWRLHSMDRLIARRMPSPGD
ncbi:MAG: glutaminase [Chromatiaceae bacterium]|nr:glutaminase [Chromatiaceae bacterium]